MTDDGWNWRERLAVTAVLAAICLLVGWDLWVDYRSGTASVHLGAETTVVIISLGGILWLWLGFRGARVRAALLERDLGHAREEAERWRNDARDLLGGLRLAMEGQFDRWELTRAEREVSLMLLKGLSHKEIASARSTGERTAREQARSVYLKSGLGGRSELAGFFLADLVEGGNPPPEATG